MVRIYCITTRKIHVDVSKNRQHNYHFLTTHNVLIAVTADNTGINISDRSKRLLGFKKLGANKSVQCTGKCARGALLSFFWHQLLYSFGLFDEIPMELQQIYSNNNIAGLYNLLHCINVHNSLYTHSLADLFIL